jgi:hypothetical protein
MIRVDQRVQDPYSNIGRNGHVREEWGEPGREGAERAPDSFFSYAFAKIAQLGQNSKDSKRLKHRGVEWIDEYY